MRRDNIFKLVPKCQFRVKLPLCRFEELILRSGRLNTLPPEKLQGMASCDLRLPNDPQMTNTNALDEFLLYEIIALF